MAPLGQPTVLEKKAVESKKKPGEDDMEGDELPQVMLELLSPSHSLGSESVLST